MTILRKCQICHEDLMDNDRVIFSTHETFVWKPATIGDAKVGGLSAAATMTPDELRESRKEHMRTAMGNTFCDWGKVNIPDGAFNFRHQWCEPVATGSGAPGLHPKNKHAIRFGRAAAGRR